MLCFVPNSFFNILIFYFCLFINIICWFNTCFDKASDKGLIHGRHFDRKYFPSFRNIDFVGLNPYLPLANHYADIILEPVKNNNENKSGKILKKHDKNN